MRPYFLSLALLTHALGPAVATPHRIAPRPHVPRPPRARSQRPRTPAPLRLDLSEDGPTGDDADMPVLDKGPL